MNNSLIKTLRCDQLLLVLLLTFCQKSDKKNHCNKSRDSPVIKKFPVAPFVCLFVDKITDQLNTQCCPNISEGSQSLDSP